MGFMPGSSDAMFGILVGEMLHVHEQLAIHGLFAFCSAHVGSNFLVDCLSDFLSIHLADWQRWVATPSGN